METIETDIKTNIEMALEVILGLIVLVAIFWVLNSSTPGVKTLPASFNLAIPFTPQAPNNNWDRNEDCEETSVAMANAFLTGNTIKKLPADAAQNAINNLKAWEQSNLGYNANTGVDATTKMAEGAFGLRIQQINNYTEEDLKSALVAGHPILMPLNAKVLNPEKYQLNGPLYHMIVIRGYKGDTFITNDPGTNGGESNQYPFSILYNASADWNQAQHQLDPNTKAALVVYK